jgi:hypothetical protein
VHVVHALNAVAAQWIGHGPWLHGFVSAPCGHFLPPFSGWRNLRVRLEKPAAHEVLHVLQDDHAKMTQGMAHECLLHCRVSAECGHT